MDPAGLVGSGSGSGSESDGGENAQPDQYSEKHQQIEAMYREHNPDKLAEVPGLLQKYGEDRLLAMMKKKYEKVDPHARVAELDRLIADKKQQMTALVAKGGTKQGFHLVTETREQMEKMEAERRQLIYQMSNVGSDPAGNVDPRIKTLDTASFAALMKVRSPADARFY
jgi:hypothetical protein